MQDRCQLSFVSQKGTFTSFRRASSNHVSHSCLYHASFMYVLRCIHLILHLATPRTPAAGENNCHHCVQLSNFFSISVLRHPLGSAIRIVQVARYIFCLVKVLTPSILSNQNTTFTLTGPHYLYIQYTPLINHRDNTPKLQVARFGFLAGNFLFSHALAFLSLQPSRKH